MSNDDATIDSLPRTNRVKGPHAPLPNAPPTSDTIASALPPEEDSRTRAARRAAELLEHGSTLINDTDGAEDQFYIDPAIIPDGWTYEYKRHTVLGKEDPSYQVSLQRNGWEAVPASRHKELMPMGYQGGIVERDGMILMERPKKITDMIIARDDARARAQVGAKEAQMYAPPPGTAPRDNKGSPLARVAKSYEPIAIPDK